MASRLFVIAALLFSMCAVANAQEISDILFGQNNKEDYMGQYNYNGKRKNGFGIERYKNGAVYVGDFVENEISGRGMLISLKKEISNVDGAYVYVGNWREGKKSGRGVCYDASGKVVYSGKFVNDKPSEKSSADSKNRSFVIKDIDNNLYLGEMSGDSQDGFGLTLSESGEIVYGSMKDGVRHKASAETPGDFRVVTSEGKLLRTYQRSMEQVRRMAKKEGFNLKVSKYETVSF